jgi:hypothetical protein
MKILLPFLALLALSGCLGMGETASTAAVAPADGPQPQAVPIPEVDSQPLPPL